MATVNIYLLFNGNCEAAFHFYQSVFGGEFLAIVRHGDVPVQTDLPPVPESSRNKIENISLRISKETILMGGDVSGLLAEKTIFGNNFSIYIEAANQEEAEKIFAGLSQGGQVTVPLSRAHWGDYFAMLMDQFGVNWFINYAPNR